MKILLTGSPGVGKSTVLNTFLKIYQGGVNGIIVNRMRDEDGMNQGFKANSLDGQEIVLAHRTLVNSDLVVGNGHHVDVHALDNFVAPKLAEAYQSKGLIIFDEIGRMQTYSAKVMELLNTIFNDFTANVLATTVYEPEPWALPFKENPNSVLVDVNFANRDLLPQTLVDVFTNCSLLGQLTSVQYTKSLDMIKKFFEYNQFVQLSKFFNNTLPYVTGKRVQLQKQAGSTSEFLVQGNTATHKTTVTEDKFTCDCDLATGKNKYADKSGVCSHIMAVKLVLSA